MSLKTLEKREFSVKKEAEKREMKLKGRSWRWRNLQLKREEAVEVCLVEECLAKTLVRTKTTGKNWVFAQKRSGKQGV